MEKIEVETKFIEPKQILKHAPIPLLRESALETKLECQYEIKKSTTSSELVKSTLTLRPRAFGSFLSPAPYYLYEETETTLRVPRIFGLLQYGIPENDLRTPELQKNRQKWETNLVLKTWQTDVVNHVKKCILTPPLNCGMLSAACGLGKTCMAIEIICQMGIKTAVLVHKEFLITQWIERISSFCPELSTGKIQGDKMEIGDVTLIMIQTVCNGKYHMDTFKDMEFVVVDECHHLCASTFNKSMRFFKARYVMGLSATLKRSDGNERGIFWLLGHPVVTCTRKSNDEIDNENSLHVKIVYSDRDCYVSEIRTANNNLLYSKMLTRLLKKESRIKIICDQTQELFKENREILIISERITLLDEIQKRLELANIPSCKYVGETSKKKKLERDELSKKSKIILTTRAMAAEGFDRPGISAVVLATPLKQGTGLEQSIGRCQRLCSNVTSKVVVDIVDNFSLFSTMAKGRENFYKQKGYKITKLNYQNTNSFGNTRQATKTLPQKRKPFFLPIKHD